MTTDQRRDALRAKELLLEPDVVMLRDGPQTGQAVVVSADKFIDIGPAAAVRARHPELTPVRLQGRCLMPGFIDAHHHLTQSFGKSLAYGEPSEIFRRVWVPLESSLDDEFLYLASKLAALESLRGGFTTVCDAGTRASGDIAAVGQAVCAAGLRCVLGLICNDGGNDSTPAQRRAVLDRAESFLAQWRGDGLVHPSLAVSIPEVASDEVLRSTTALCRQAGAVFQTHVNEHLASVERCIVARGMRPLELMHDLQALGPQVLIAHGTLVTPGELGLLADTDTAVAYNPVASQWKGNAVAPALMMARLGIRFGLGTDATRSDGFRLMDAAEAAQKLAFAMHIGDASSGAGWTWFDHATGDGANAVGLGTVTGEIAPGKQADFLIVDIDTPEMCSTFDLTWDLVRLGNRDQIEAVFVAGAMRLWQGWPPDWDARALMEEVARRARSAVSRAPIQRLHLPAAQDRARAAARRSAATASVV
jgi:cytosine/adenosine deaminase-related metal-dependent hydrolase